jgi:hypothetical protein
MTITEILQGWTGTFIIADYAGPSSPLDQRYWGMRRGAKGKGSVAKILSKRMVGICPQDGSPNSL